MIGVEFVTRSIQVDDKVVEAQIWDTASRERCLIYLQVGFLHKLRFLENILFSWGKRFDLGVKCLSVFFEVSCAELLRFGCKELDGIINYGSKELFADDNNELVKSCQIHYDDTAIDRKVVQNIHLSGGSLLGVSRGGPTISEIVDSMECRKRRLKVAVVGVPKTIDNDILFMDKTFGFDTAVEEAQRAIYSAYIENPSQVHKNVMLEMHSASEQVDDAMKLYKSMTNAGLRPGLSTYTALLTLLGKKKLVDVAAKTINGCKVIFSELFISFLAKVILSTYISISNYVSFERKQTTPLQTQHKSQNKGVDNKCQKWGTNEWTYACLDKSKAATSSVEAKV
ncbi:hypothetical protein DH2020_045860 [Rehmannia glutinosa]|uniref:Phosphofructokinase domain-containing protein n=1 Tax=Rehmannia glutinosa TaxID=99300 RepID=A0ABR0UCX9_REHGL